MALAFVADNNTLNTNDVDHTTTITPQIGEMIIAIAHQSDGTVGSLTVTDDRSGTYTKILSGTHGATNQHTFEIFARNSLVAAANLHTFTQTRAGTTTGGGIYVQRWTGFTAVGASCCRQTNTNRTVTAGGGTPTATMATAILTGNATVGVVMSATATQTEPTGWTEQNDNTTYNSPTICIQVVSRDSGSTDTSVAWGATSATDFGVGFVELQAVASSAHNLSLLGAGS